MTGSITMLKTCGRTDQIVVAPAQASANSTRRMSTGPCIWRQTSAHAVSVSTAQNAVSSGNPPIE